MVMALAPLMVIVSILGDLPRGEWITLTEEGKAYKTRAGLSFTIMSRRHKHRGDENGEAVAFVNVKVQKGAESASVMLQSGGGDKEIHAELVSFDRLWVARGNYGKLTILLVDGAPPKPLTDLEARDSAIESATAQKLPLHDAVSISPENGVFLIESAGWTARVGAYTKEVILWRK
jgi:hypothetical protein